MNRRACRTIRVRDVEIGGSAPISVQSMTNTDTRDVGKTLAQIRALHAAGCDLVRVSVYDVACAKAVRDLVDGSPCPLVADIHFDYQLALEAVRQGIDKVRINPGNIGAPERVKAVAEACMDRSIPIRIGVNGGSLEKRLLEQYGGPTPEALVESGLRQAQMLEQFGFHDICISLKSSSVSTTMKAYRLMSERCDYPLHLGVTEAGTPELGVIKSAAGIGGLLALGIGDTFRVTLTADPVEEIFAAKKILKAVGLRREGPELIACPTCGRTKIDLIPMARRVEDLLRQVDKPITVAVMGCVVNGPGEARHADVGIAGGQGEGVLFQKGQVVARVPEDRLVDELMKLIDTL